MIHGDPDSKKWSLKNWKLYKMGMNPYVELLLIILQETGVCRQWSVTVHKVLVLTVVLGGGWKYKVFVWAVQGAPLAAELGEPICLHLSDLLKTVGLQEKSCVSGI